MKHVERDTTAVPTTIRKITSEKREMFVIFSSTSRRCLVFSNTPKGEKDARREQQIELKGKRVTTGMEKVILNALTDRSFFNFLLHIAPYPPFPFIVPIPSYEKPEASVERMMNMPIWES